MEENETVIEAVSGVPEEKKPMTSQERRVANARKKYGIKKRVWTPEQREAQRQRLLQRHHPEDPYNYNIPKAYTGPDPDSLPAAGSPSVDTEIREIEAAIAPALAGPLTREVERVSIETPQKPTKHAVTAPWRPARLMDIPKRLMNPNYKYRFVNTLKPGNVMKKKQEGWEPDTELQTKLDGMGKTLDDPRSSLDSATPVRELILMRMPVEMAKARADYYQSVTIDPTKPGVMKQTLKKNADEEVEKGANPILYGDVDIQTANTRR